jgi:hypothetical protein
MNLHKNLSQKPKKYFEELIGEDFYYEDYIEKVKNKYATLIGKFLIEFSYLEHTLNLSIAWSFADDLHEIGYTIIENLKFSQKIDLFYKLYVREEVMIRNKKTKPVLNKIIQELEEINSFRNNIVHANWESLKEDCTVRTKIIVDREGEGVKFKRVKMTPELIREKLNEIDDLIEEIDEYKYTP